MSQAPQSATPTKSNDQYLAAWDATMKLLREGHSFSGRERNCVFLNCGTNGRFANVSAISGLDFLDDARAIAMVDWDHDGDLDCWLHNRTGPRLRFMKNQTRVSSSDNNYLAIRLEGTSVNRDAIGARVKLLFRDSQQPTMMQTLYAGDAFLSQSSKWLHFGLGRLTVDDLRGVEVRWPGGEPELFSIATTRCLLMEGTGQAVSKTQDRLVQLEATAPLPLAIDSAIRIPLVNRPPLPLLDAQAVANGRMQQLEFGGRPKLLVLWASWCPTCQHELKALAAEDSPVDVLAVAMDPLAAAPPEAQSVAKIAEDWGLRFPIYLATHEFLDKLNLLRRVTLNRVAPLAVPTSILVDRQGRAAVIYLGPIQPHVLVADVDRLDASLIQRRDLAIPFAGKWTTPPRNLLMRPVANIFRDRGYTDDYARFLTMELDAVKAKRASATDDAERRELDRQWSGDHFNIAFAHEQQRDFVQAIDYYRQGLAAYPEDAPAWQRLASCLRQVDRIDEAVATLQAGIKAVPEENLYIDLAKLLREQGDLARAAQQLESGVKIGRNSARIQFHLASILAEQGKRQAAEQHLRTALTFDDEHFESLLNLGALLASNKSYPQAVTFLARATSIQPDHLGARLNLAKTYLAVDRLEEAQQQLQAVLVRDPENAQAHLGLAQIASAQQRPDQLRDHLQAAIQINTSDTASKLRLAWLLATSDRPDIRDAARALTLATSLAKETDGKHPIVLDTLAVAQAANGRYVAAIATARRAISILNAAGQQKMSQEVESRMNLYQQKKPFVQPQPNEVQADRTPTAPTPESAEPD